MRKSILFALAILLCPHAGLAGTAKPAWIHHGNQAFTDNGSLALILGDPGYVGNSYHRTLDTHFYYAVPVDIHMSGPLTQSYAWNQNGNNLLGRLGGSSLVDMAGGFYAENIAPYAQQDMNEYALSYESYIDSTLIKKPGWPDSPTVIWIPERVWKNHTLMPYSLVSILNSKYGKWDNQSHWVAPCIVLDGATAHDWYAHTFPDHTPCHNWHKIHRLWDAQGNYVYVAFICSTARNNWVWNNVSVPGQELNSHLWGLSNASDQEQICIYGDDWEKAAGVAGWDFGQAGVPANSYDANISWADRQSWIQPVHIGEAAKWWGVDKVYDADPLNDPPSIDIPYAAYPELNGWTGGTYDNWYDDFKNIQSYDCANAQDMNGNSIRGDFEDLWMWGRSQLIAQQDNDLSKLGWTTLLSQLYETAWHDWLQGNDGYGLSPWDKNMWNHARHAGAFAKAASWYASLGTITQAKIETGDFDGDGTNEYCVYNNKMLAIFDRRGGRSLFVFTSDGDCVVGNSMTNWGGEGDWDDGGHPGLLQDTQAENTWFTVVIDSSGGPRVRLTLNAGSFKKSVSLGYGDSYLQVDYSGVTENWTKAGVTPDEKDILEKGYALQSILGLSANGWMYGGYRNTRSNTKATFLWGSGNNLYYQTADRIAVLAEKLELHGRPGSYTIYFYAGSGSPEVNAPGPGDLEGPGFANAAQEPSNNVAPTDSVLVTDEISDPSGIGGAWIHYGVNGQWTYPDIVMHEDNGSTYDWDHDHQADSGLFGGKIGPQASGSRVEYAIKAQDNSARHNVSWDNNGGRNYAYTVGVITFVMDGLLDDLGFQLAANGEMKLWAYYYADSSLLYVATQAAGDSQGGFNNDHFIFVSVDPDTPKPAPWNKSGMVADWDAYLGDENDNSFIGWYNRNNGSIDTTIAKKASGPTDDYVMEGILDIKALLGYEPALIHVCVGTYATENNGILQWQVPRWTGSTMNADLDSTEYETYSAVSVLVSNYTTVVPRGGTVTFRATLVNHTVERQSVQAWTMATLPNSGLYGPLLGPARVSLAPYANWSYNASETVPATAPLGNYTYRLRIGTYPSTVTDETTFPVTVTATSR